MFSFQRKKNQRNIIKNKFQEQWLRKKDALKKKIDRAKKKGNERLIIMFIPHSEKKIFNFHLSIFTILAIGIATLVLIIASAIFINNLETSQTEILKYSRSSLYNKQLIHTFNKCSDYASKNFNRLLEQADYLIKNFIQQEKKQATNKQAIEAPPNMHLKRLHEISQNLATRAQQLHSIRTLFNHVKQRIRYIPSIWPVVGGGYITSPFGERPSPFTGIPVKHSGVDIAWWPGSPIRSTADGIVTDATTLGGYGLCVVIKHKYGYSSRYAHLQNFWVKKGDRVTKGQIIGNMGNSGFATGYHLHYEVILEIEAIDPAPFLRAKFY